MKIKKLVKNRLASKKVLQIVRLWSSNLLTFFKFLAFSFLVICALIDLLVFSRAILAKSLDSLIENCQELHEAQEEENRLFQKPLFFKLRTIRRSWQIF